MGAFDFGFQDLRDGTSRDAIIKEHLI